MGIDGPESVEGGSVTSLEAERVILEDMMRNLFVRRDYGIKKEHKGEEGETRTVIEGRKGHVAEV